MAYLFKIKLKGITKPPVWRKVSVPENITFLQFHQVIQTVFSWYDYHLFEFKDKEYRSNFRIALPHEDDFDLFTQVYDASETKLSEIFSDKVKKLLYVYDFGDDWVHEITLESVSEDNPNKAYCISGKGTCPPEDCGGTYGYEHLKQVFQEMPDSKKAQEFREWLGLDDDEDWDPDLFCAEEKKDINEDLKNL